MAPRDALIADSVPQSRWGLAYGFHRAMDTTGAFLGPLLGLALVALLTLREIFLVALIPAAAAVLLIAFVRDAPRPRTTGPRGRLPRDGPLFSYVLTIAVFTLGNFGYLFLLLAAAEGGQGIAGLLTLQLVYTAVFALLATPLGAATDRWGRPPLIALAITATAAGSLLMVLLAPQSWLAFGAASAAFEGNGRALAADLAPAPSRGSVLGAYHAAIGLAALPGGLLAGLLWTVRPEFAFLAMALFCAAALMEFTWLWSRGNFPRRG
jgi:MFS family permease